MTLEQSLLGLAAICAVALAWVRYCLRHERKRGRRLAERLDSEPFLAPFSEIDGWEIYYLRPGFAAVKGDEAVKAPTISALVRKIEIAERENVTL